MRRIIEYIAGPHRAGVDFNSQIFSVRNYDTILSLVLLILVGLIGLVLVVVRD